MDVVEYAFYQVNRGDAAAFGRDMAGAAQVFANDAVPPPTEPYSRGSTLNRVFDRFVKRTGLGENSETLSDEFLSQNPRAREAMSTYAGLENSFAARGREQQTAVVDFLNIKIDDFLADREQAANGTLTLERSDMSETLYEAADNDTPRSAPSEDRKNAVFEEFKVVNDVLNYFQTSPGSLIDIYG